MGGTISSNARTQNAPKINHDNMKKKNDDPQIELLKTQADEAIAKSRFEAVRAILSDDSLKEAFIHFLCFETMDILEKKTLNERILPLKGIHPEQIPLMASLLVEYCNFVIRSGAVDCSSSIGAAFCDTSDLNNLLRPADIIAITLEAYPKFLQSHEYKRWKDKQDNPKMTMTRREEIVSRIPFENEENKKNAICRAIASVDKREIERIIQAGSILTSIIAAVETLPVCVCISTARRDRPGFPLIYVNASFEEVTGYSRNEIIGQNCRFLQGGKSEIDAIKRLTTALKNAKPVRTAITNFRKDGFPFKNLLSMKPIFDENGEYSYVIGVQFDVTQADSTPAKLKLADDVINILPNVIVSTSNDDD